MEDGPPGYIVHWSSDKLVHPYGGSDTPTNDTTLVVHSEGRRREGAEYRLQFRFVAVPDAGHFGYIEHVPSKKIVHPYGGYLDPSNDSKLVYHTDRHAACLFAFDEDGNRIIHRSGKIWHPYGGAASPWNNTSVVLHSDRHEAACFYFVNTSMKKVSPYPPPNLSLEWIELNSSIDPQEQHQLSFVYKVGVLRSKTVTNVGPTDYRWTISADKAKMLFSASSKYSNFIVSTSANTWNDETEVRTTRTVQKGKSVVIWQCTFVLEQYGDEYKFRSNILESTDSSTRKPLLN